MAKGKTVPFLKREVKNSKKSFENTESTVKKLSKSPSRKKKSIAKKIKK